MTAIKFAFQVLMDDGETWNITADQRDLARYEAQDFWAPERLNTASRFLAWSAAKRQKLTKLSWEQWGDKCVEVIDADDGEEKDLDPTQPDPSGESS